MSVGWHTMEMRLYLKPPPKVELQASLNFPPGFRPLSSTPSPSSWQQSTFPDSESRRLWGAPRSTRRTLQRNSS